MPIAHYFTTNLKGNNFIYSCMQLNIITILSGEQIFPLVWDVIESLEMYDTPVVSLTSDGAKSNLSGFAPKLA